MLDKILFVAARHGRGLFCVAAAAISVAGVVIACIAATGGGS